MRYYLIKFPRHDNDEIFILFFSSHFPPHIISLITSLTFFLDLSLFSSPINVRKSKHVVVSVWILCNTLLSTYHVLLRMNQNMNRILMQNKFSCMHNLKIYICNNFIVFCFWKMHWHQCLVIHLEKKIEIEENSINIEFIWYKKKRKIKRVK